jgi:1-deoxy-D-xylulose-5-phosphate synthase
MSTGCSLNLMMAKMPSRTFDVGIAEQHAVTFSAGMAASGYMPFCNIYSTFMQRAYDQIIHDVALQKLPVVFCLDRGGLVGEDGATHHGVYDLAYLRCIPNMVVASPMNEEELRDMMFTAQLPGMGPFAIRYPKGRGVLPQWKTPLKKMEVGKGRMVSDGADMAVITIGHVGNYAVEACKKAGNEGLSVAHFDLRFVKPLDEELLDQVFKKHSRIITVEDGSIMGGMGSAVLEFMVDHGYAAKVVRMGVPDCFIEQGTVAELHEICGFDAKGIFNVMMNLR